MFLIKTKTGFTLVELLVSITILSVLSTVGFISYVSNISDTRDSKRLTNIAQVYPALKISKEEYGEYPTPGDSFTITNSGLIVAYQGKLNQDIGLNSIDNIPFDPYVNIPYTYSVTKNKQEAQISLTLENNDNNKAIIGGDYQSVSRNVLPSITLAKQAPAGSNVEIHDGVSAGTTNRESFVLNEGVFNLPYTFEGDNEPYNAGGISFTGLVSDTNNKFEQNIDYRTCKEIFDDAKVINTGYMEEYQLRSSTGVLYTTGCTFNLAVDIDYDLTMCDPTTYVVNSSIIEGIPDVENVAWQTIDNSKECYYACSIDYYQDAPGVCNTAGNGYYSLDFNNSRIACTNGPSDSVSRDYYYTNVGGGVNNCPYNYNHLCAVDRYEPPASPNTCAVVGNGSYSPNLNNSRTACTNHPDIASRNYTYTSDGNGTNNCNATYTDLCGIDLYESFTLICSAVGNGFYSLANNNSMVACTNHPDNASRNYTSYTSDGNGANSCSRAYTPKCGVDLYESSEGTCSAVGNGRYSPNLNNTRYSCTNGSSDNTSRNYSYSNDGNGINNCSQTYTAKCGVDLYESSEGTCSAVGNGYYSPNLNNTRYSCSNHPDTTSRNYTYSSDGNGSNSCNATYTPKCTMDRYETSNGSCPRVGNGYYSPNLNNTRYSCSNKPANSSYTTDGNGSNSCGYTCTGGYSGPTCATAPYTCVSQGWKALHRGARLPVDYDTGPAGLGYTLAGCHNRCISILNSGKYTGNHICVRRPAGRCHLTRNDVVTFGALEADRSYEVLNCTGN